MKLIVKKGTTSKRVAIFIQDSSVTTGAGKTGLAWNTASLSWYYWREDEGNANATSVTLATATRGTFASGGFVEKDATNLPGFYEIGIPNNALATGANWVVMCLKGAANMAPVTIEIQLVDFDPGDGVRLGLTSLPNAAAEAAGGLFTRGSGAGQINQAANGQIDSKTVAMANDVITAAAIATGAVDADAIADNAIDAGAIAADAITSSKIATGAIDADAIAANAIGASELATDAVSEIVDAVWAKALETGFTADRLMRIIAAAVAGKVSGGPGSPVFRNVGDTLDQITGTADASGNRSAASYGA